MPAHRFTLLDRELPRLSMIRHTPNRRRALERFRANGRIEIDSNIVERAIWPHISTAVRLSVVCPGTPRPGGPATPLGFGSCEFPRNSGLTVAQAYDYI